jgi:cullin 3
LFRNDTTSAEVRESRKILSDAAIVKIMKQQQSSKLRPLVDAVKKELSYMWHASGSELSKRVEDLIERDYLERDETDQLMLLYVA